MFLKFLGPTHTWSQMIRSLCPSVNKLKGYLMSNHKTRLRAHAGHMCPHFFSSVNTNTDHNEGPPTLVTSSERPPLYKQAPVYLYIKQEMIINYQSLQVSLRMQANTGLLCCSHCSFDNNLYFSWHGWKKLSQSTLMQKLVEQRSQERGRSRGGHELELWGDCVLGL